MVTNNTYEYGIKYQVQKISNDSFLMCPVSIEGGLSDSKIFSTGDRMEQILKEKKDLKFKYVMDNIFTTDDLETMYDYGEDTEFLSKYFYQDFQNIYYIVKVLEDGSLELLLDIPEIEKEENKILEITSLERKQTLFRRWWDFLKKKVVN